MRCGRCEKELHECKCVWAIPIVCQRCGEVNPAEIHTCTPMQPEPMIDGCPLYSGLPPAKVQDERETQYKSWAQSAQVIGTPQREWVGLTKEEVELWELPASPTVYEFALFVEAKLKEKNA